MHIDRIPTVEECEAIYRCSIDSEWTISLMEGYNIPIPPKSEDIYNHYVMLRKMGYTQEEVTSGRYKLSPKGDIKESTTDN